MVLPSVIKMQEMIWPAVDWSFGFGTWLLDFSAWKTGVWWCETAIVFQHDTAFGNHAIPVFKPNPRLAKLSIAAIERIGDALQNYTLARMMRLTAQAWARRD
jgi:hypothetical protein